MNSIAKSVAKLTYNALTTLALQLGLIQRGDLNAINSDDEVNCASGRITAQIQSMIGKQISFQAKKLKTGKLVPLIDSIALM
jgi:hypothetical protein